MEIKQFIKEIFKFQRIIKLVYSLTIMSNVRKRIHPNTNIFGCMLHYHKLRNMVYKTNIDEQQFFSQINFFGACLAV